MQQGYWEGTDREGKLGLFPLFFPIPFPVNGSAGQISFTLCAQNRSCSFWWTGFLEKKFFVEMITHSLSRKMTIFVCCSKNPHVRTYWFKNLQVEIWHLNTQIYKSLLSPASAFRLVRPGGPDLTKLAAVLSLTAMLINQCVKLFEGERFVTLGWRGA